VDRSTVAILMSTTASETREREGIALLVALKGELAAGLEARLGAGGLTTMRAKSAEDVTSLLDFNAVEVVIAGGIEPGALEKLCDVCSDVPIVAVVDGDDQSARENALREGAVATISATPTDEELRLALERALPNAEGPPSSEDPPPPARRRNGLLGTSEPMRHVVELISRTATVTATVLVRGETGTGKELVARALHDESARRDGPFVKVHCAALPDALLESEIFGYEKGAFTGAVARKPGRVELAEGGTLFLDEIGDITPAMQVKLLRLLQEKEYERLGGVRTLRANVRFVTATHRDLEGMVKRGEFREDLFYRLNVVTLWLPPLRARRDDIPLLAKEFAAEFAKTYGKPALKLDDSAISALRSERWPGNVRQLQNFIERLVVLAVNPTITADDMRREMTAQTEFKTQLTSATAARRPNVGTLTSSGSAAASSVSASTDAGPPSSIPTLDQATRDAEKRALERALRHAGGNRTVAARVLGVSRATVYTKMQEYGIK
jgi:two-component system response regulator AtoC